MFDRRRSSLTPMPTRPSTLISLAPRMSRPDPARPTEPVWILVADLATGAAWQRRRARLLAETIDVTEHMIDLVVAEGSDDD
jgi:hypothetical protein